MARKDSELQRIQVFFPRTKWQWLKKWCEKHDKSRGEVVRRCVEAYMCDPLALESLVLGPCTHGQGVYIPGTENATHAKYGPFPAMRDDGGRQRDKEGEPAEDAPQSAKVDATEEAAPAAPAIAPQQHDGAVYNWDGRQVDRAQFERLLAQARGVQLEPPDVPDNTEGET